MSIVLPQEYADAVSLHAKQGLETSLYPGLNFANLASLLQQPFKHRRNRASSAALDYQSYPFACRHKFNTLGDRSIEWFQRLEDLNAKSPPGSGEKSHHILFLRGLPSSRWLSTIGGLYRVDPEFFQRHLDFWSTVGRLNYFPLPSLRSSSESMIELRYISIGQRESVATRLIQNEANAQRQASEKAMSRYIHNLNVSLDGGGAVGTSIVRDFDLQDETHFAIEQRISIYINKGGDARTTIVWIDTGRALDQGPDGPWTEFADKRNVNNTIFHPIIQILPHIALKAHKMSLDTTPLNDSASSRPNAFAQSSALLTNDYGKNLDAKLMAVDPFYALHELFLFCAFSQSQYLNMLESKLDSDAKAQASSGQVADVSNLLYRQSILARHAERLRGNIATIETRGGLHRSRPAEGTAETVQQQAANHLLVNYQQLLAKAETLSRQCQAQMALLMNRTMIAESNKAIKQAQEVTKLTRLAFVFVPLGFTASFSGMNLSPFISTGPPIWWWFVLSSPFLIISFIVLKWDITRLWKDLYNIKTRKS